MRVVAPVLALASALAACGSSATPRSSSTSSLSGSITVYAASSLAKAFTELGTTFEHAHPGTHVKFDFDSSSVLVTQIRNGAPADVFASADQKNMQKLATDTAAAPVVFAKNRMEIAVGAGNPKHISTVADLERSGLIVVLCASEAPCGKYADQLLDQDRITLTPKSREIDAKSTLSKVQLGDADAAIVYVTDVEGAAGKIDGIAIPNDKNVVATLPIAALRHSGNAALAQAWVDFVTSADSEHTLQRRFGFLAP